MWEPYKKGFKVYLQLEKSLADNSVQAYGRDLELLTHFLLEEKIASSPSEITLKNL